MSLERKVFMVEKTPLPPADNLAINQHCTNLIQEEKYSVIARVYYHTKGIILGYNESREDVQEEFCKKQGYEIVKRRSGGSAVVVNPELVICYSILFNQERTALPKDLTKMYETLTITLAKNLGSNFSVEGTYYVRFRQNGTSIPIAGHAIKNHDGKTIQFDGIVNRTSFDMNFLEQALKLRTLYEQGSIRYLKIGNEVYTLKGQPVITNLSDARVVRDEKKELGKVIGLRELGLDDEMFKDALYKTIQQIFGNLNWESRLPIHHEQIQSLKRELGERKGRKFGLGHCFIDLLEPEPKLHYATP